MVTAGLAPVANWNAGARMEAASVPSPAGLRRTRKRGDRIGDVLLYGLTAFASLVGLLIVAAIVWRVTDGAWPAIKVFKLGFLWHNEFNPVTSKFGARDLIIGTLVTSFGAMLLAAPLSIAIGLFLSELAPPAVRGPVGTLIEMLAAVPSVVDRPLGHLRARTVRRAARPAVPGRALRLDPDLRPRRRQGRIDRVHRDDRADDHDHPDHVVDLPRALRRRPDGARGGAIGLGATRWEMVKTVVIPTVRGGVVAAVILGLGRALGEAIAVSQVIGNFTPLKLSIFEPGDTLASRVANQYQGAVSNLHVASLIYLALILLAITFITNFTAQRVVKRFEFQRTGGS